MIEINLSKNQIAEIGYQTTIVKFFLMRLDLNLDFIICGGSIYNIVNNIENNNNDIDVFFKSEKDFNLLKTKIENDQNIFFSDSGNALHINSSSTISPRPIQFIYRNFGTPEEILSNFDFNCSRCFSTTDNKVFVHESFSRIITLNEKNIFSGSLSRYQKYTQVKKAVDPDNKTIDFLIERILNEPYKEYDSCYSESGISGIQMINLFLAGCYELEINDLIYNKVVEKFKEEERLEIFKILYTSFTMLSEKLCDELICLILSRPKEARGSLICFLDTKTIDKETKTRVKTIYPEFFI